MTPKEHTVPEPQSLGDTVTNAIGWVAHTQKCTFSQRSKCQLPAWLGSGEGSLPGLQMVGFCSMSSSWEERQEGGEGEGEKGPKRKKEGKGRKEGMGRRHHISSSMNSILGTLPHHLN